jgi:hypothetical protein
VRRLWLGRFWAIWVAFGLGTAVGALVMEHYLGHCDVRLVNVDTDALTRATQAALPAAITGSGVVVYTLDPTGIRVHADSLFQNQTYDQRILAVVRGSPVTLEVSSRLLQRLMGH